MRGRTTLWAVVCAGLVAAGCGTYSRTGVDHAQARTIAESLRRRAQSIPPALEDRILALDPTNVSAADVRGVLVGAPAPRILSIHGGLARVRPRLESFAEFLMGMGYPGASLTNPGDGTYTFSCYENARKVAGCAAWYYEQEGMRPMLIGHSQGGFQVMKVLHLLAAEPGARLEVWNPLTWEKEDRNDILDPLTGGRRPVVGLEVSFAASIAAGGVTRFLPNQWSLCGRLRSVPDSAEEFAGYYKGMDVLGGDFLGYGPANEFKPSGRALVRNVSLPAAWKHGRIPDVKHLLMSPVARERLDAYRPPPGLSIRVASTEEAVDPETRFLPWAEDVWYGIKKHWVLELQRLIRARREKGGIDG